ncbi:transporter substrate-binding domain-containing protein [Falsiroseomonas oryzae]|uniref:transporter substrate-binding domain-containing protein n=1 Tax=Falsiroseomonas oryzae TaxID=2766473 RepID=UPI0022EA643A|nr:transporter substrate-binding domain-containing protein [Roseomonas sp. MO-31]
MPRVPVRRRAVVTTGPAFLAALAAHGRSGSAQPRGAADAVRAGLAPTGRLRAALIVSNPVLVRRDPAAGTLGGVSVELATALAVRIGVPFEPVPYANPARYAESLSAEIPWDVGFAARDPARGQFLDFSPDFMHVDNVFLVPAGSGLSAASDIDRPGVRVAVPQGSAPDLFLTRTLRMAGLVRVPGGADQAVEVLASGRADAYGENAHLLHDVMGRLPTGGRILDGRFNVVRMAVAVPKGRGPEALQEVGRFVASARRDGTVARAIGRAGLRGVHVAPDES